MDTGEQSVGLEGALHAMVCDAVQDALSGREAATTNALSALAERQADSDIQLWKPYNAAEVANFLSISRSRVYDIPEAELKPTWVGAGRGSKRYLGINLVCYITGLDPVDAEAIGRKQREAFLAQAKRPLISSNGEEQRVV